MTHDPHHSQPLRAIDQMHREPDPKLEAEADARILAAVEAERERARMNNNLMAFEIKLVGDRVQRQTSHLQTLVDITRRMESVQREGLAELRAIKSAMTDLAKPDATQEAILNTLRNIDEGIATYVRMRTNGDATEH